MNGAATKYRPDIDGLRALAIVPVVAFHAFPEWVRGGFVGVDVFFVISGYLISLVIFEHLDRGTFTFSEFYARRIRRIFPALALVLVACTVWGWFRLFAGEYAQLGKHVAAGAGFAANLVLWSEAGYFDVASDAKPLLHLWSLGIEEQFYLFWPFLLVLAWTRGLSPLAVLAAIFGASFLLNVVQVRTDEIAAFYSPATRLWELVLGAFFAYATMARTSPRFARPWIEASWRRFTPALQNAAALAGVAAIVAAVFWFNADTSFPGWRAALPAGGTLLIIAAGPGAWLNRRVLSARALVWVGLISYPLYLWHRPLLSLATLSSGTPPAATRLGLVAASVVFATLTYLLIERFIRWGAVGRKALAPLTLMMAVTGAAGYLTYAMEGWHERPLNRSDEAHFIDYYERLRQRGLRSAYRAECDFMDWDTEAIRPAIDADCTTAGKLGTLFLWGDSHAQALSLGIRSALPSGVRLAQVATSGCAPRLHDADPTGSGRRCAVANAFARDSIARLRPDIVILAQIMAHEATDWVELARGVRALGAKRVVLVGPAPQWLPSLPAVITSHYWKSDVDRVDHGLNAEVLTTDAQLRARLEESDVLEYVSLIGALCDQAGCLATVPGGGRRLVAIDQGHLSPEGSTFVAQTILRPYLHLK